MWHHEIMSPSNEPAYDVTVDITPSYILCPKFCFHFDGYLISRLEILKWIWNVYSVALAQIPQENYS